MTLGITTVCLHGLYSKGIDWGLRRGCNESHRDRWIQRKIFTQREQCQKNQNQKRAGSGFCYFMKPEPTWPRIGKHVWADSKTCVNFLSNQVYLPTYASLDFSSVHFSKYLLDASFMPSPLLVAGGREENKCLWEGTFQNLQCLPCQTSRSSCNLHLFIH